MKHGKYSLLLLNKAQATNGLGDGMTPNNDQGIFVKVIS